MIALTHKRATVNGVTLHYVTVGKGPVVLCMHGWPQNHREFLPLIEGFADQYTFIAPDLRGFADSDKPYDGYEPKTIAEDMLGLLALREEMSGLEGRGRAGWAVARKKGATCTVRRALKRPALIVKGRKDISAVRSRSRFQFRELFVTQSRWSQCLRTPRAV